MGRTEWRRVLAGSAIGAAVGLVAVAAAPAERSSGRHASPGRSFLERHAEFGVAFWRGGGGGALFQGALTDSPLSPEGFLRPVERVARDLLGCLVVSEVGGEVTAGQIVETEAYGGAWDPASHASVRSGRTPRNDPMFGPPGTAYLYLCYGVHWCLNVVTGREGEPQAVLIRALKPLAGLEVMERRRGRKEALARGPGRLTQALGLGGGLNGHPLQHAPLILLPGEAVEPGAIARSGRIGIRRAREWRFRFYLRDHSDVSSGPHHPDAASGSLNGGLFPSRP